MDFFDAEGNILVPKSARPIINIEPTKLGEKKGSINQYRHGNLHIREYQNYYSVHYDKIDPRNDPIGHVMIDAPQYGIGSLLFEKLAKKYLGCIENES